METQIDGRILSNDEMNSRPDFFSEALLLHAGFVVADRKGKHLVSTRIVGGRVPDYPGIHVSHRDVRGGYRRERCVCDSS